ncbi:Concanavalin A-like lectin/glucanase domain containing protein [Naviculisporaceae sp. PSN 640]
MKSATPLAVLAGLYTQATALVHSRSVSYSVPGVLTTLSSPHSPIRLLHRHPESYISTGKRQTSTSPDSLQGGAVLSVSNSKIKTVTASFTVPRAEIPQQGPTANNPVGVYAASFWVGIDGVSVSVPPPLPSSNISTTYGGDTAAAQNDEECNPSKASLRLGIDIFYDGTFGGEQTPFAWYQTLPGYAVGFGNFSVAPGDFVRLTSSVSSSPNWTAGTGTAGEGTVTIENFGPSTSSSSTQQTRNKKNKKAARALQSATHTFSALPSGLCQTQAAFIVEDFPLAGLPNFAIALTNFTSVEFGDLNVQTTDGESLSLTNQAQAEAQVQTLNIYQTPQGGRLTDCAITGRTNNSSSSEKVVCKRVVVP